LIPLMRHVVIIDSVLREGLNLLFTYPSYQ
jgi:hypothetical protein